MTSFLDKNASNQHCIAKSGANEYGLSDTTLLNLCTKFKLTERYCPTFGNALTLQAIKTDPMWEELKVYKQLDKAAINPTFKKFGNTLVSLINGYSIDQTTSVIKLSRQVNHLEQAVFIEKDKGSYNLNVRTSIKPVDFYRRHKFTLLNIVPLGEILNNYRRTFYPLTQEWNDLAIYLATRIKTEVEYYFQKYNSYEKIIDRRKEVEPKDSGLDNKYELLIYAAVRTKNKSLLNFTLTKN